MATDDDVRIKIKADDEASAVFEAVRDNIMSSLSGLDLAGGSIGRLSKGINDLPIAKLNETTEGMKGLGAEALSVSATVLSVASNLKNLVGWGLRLKELFAAGVLGDIGLLAGPVALPLWAGYQGSKERKAALDEIFNRNSQATTGSVARDEAVAAVQSRWDSWVENRRPGNAAWLDALNAKDKSRFDANAMLESIRERASLVGGGEADRAAAQMRESLKNSTLEVEIKRDLVESARREGAAIDEANAKLRERLDLETRLEHMREKAVSSAESWREKLMTDKEKQQRERNQVMGLWGAGMLSMPEMLKAFKQISTEANGNWFGNALQSRGGRTAPEPMTRALSPTVSGSLRFGDADQHAVRAQRTREDQLKELKDATRELREIKRRVKPPVAKWGV